jgi:uncharacterized protein YaeQ
LALNSTIYSFAIDLSDADRDCYETLSLRVAQHPSETEHSLVARVLAYCLEYQEGIEFSRGLCDADEPAIAVRDLTGARRAWIDVGAPAADRLHRAAKAAPRVAVYTFKESTQWLAGLSAADIHRAGEIAIHAIEPALVQAIVARLERRLGFALTVSDRELFVALDAITLTGRVDRLRLA